MSSQNSVIGTSQLIGIGRGLAASPLPHHRTYGSRIRRFGGLGPGESSPQPEPWVPECQQQVHPRCRARSPAPRRMPSRRSTTGHASCPPFRPSAHPRGGLASPLPRLSAVGCLTRLACGGPTMPSADFCEVVRGDGSPLSPPRGHHADLPRSAVIPSVHRRRIYKVRPNGGWRTLWSRAHSSRAYHTSYPVRVPRPARAFHAAFRPHLTVTPWRFPGPSAPRIPGRGTFTPKHDRMHGTHAGPEPRGPPRRLQALVRQYLFRRPSRGLPAVCVATLKVGVWE